MAYIRALFRSLKTQALPEGLPSGRLQVEASQLRIRIGQIHLLAKAIGWVARTLSPAKIREVSRATSGIDYRQVLVVGHGLAGVRLPNPEPPGICCNVSRRRSRQQQALRLNAKLPREETVSGTYLLRGELICRKVGEDRGAQTAGTSKRQGKAEKSSQLVSHN